MYKIITISEFDQEKVSSFIKHKISDIRHSLLVSKNFKGKNLSFILCDNKLEIKAFCSLTFESKFIKDKKWKLGTLFGLSLPGFIVSKNITNNELKNIISQVLQEINRICIRNSISVIKICFSDFIDFDLSSEKAQILKRLLINDRYLDISLIGNRVNLKEDLNVLLKRISKGHKAIIKKNTYSVKFNSRNKILNFKNFSHITNDSVDKKNLFEMYKEGFLEIADVYDKKKKIAFGIFSKVNDTVEYLFSNNITNAKNAHHYLVYEALRRYKEEGFNFFNFGFVAYGCTLQYVPTEKHFNIAIFKRGFKGDQFPLVIYEKYFSKKFFKTHQELRIKAFSDLINE